VIDGHPYYNDEHELAHYLVLLTIAIETLSFFVLQINSISNARNNCFSSNIKRIEDTSITHNNKLNQLARSQDSKAVGITPYPEKRSRQQKHFFHVSRFNNNCRHMHT
jgi:hypothetical protein